MMDKKTGKINSFPVNIHTIRRIIYYAICPEIPIVAKNSFLCRGIKWIIFKNVVKESTNKI